jgi:hypothetical protein
VGALDDALAIAFCVGSEQDLHRYEFTEDHEDGDGTDPDGDVAVNDASGSTTVLISNCRSRCKEMLTFGSLRGTILASVSIRIYVM